MHFAAEHPNAVVVFGDDGNILRDVTVTFHLEFPAGEDGDKARDRIDVALKACVKAGVPVETVDSSTGQTMEEYLPARMLMP